MPGRKDQDREIDASADQFSSPGLAEQERAAPVVAIPGDPTADNPAEGMGLCLSGGGYRAMLFHAGVLWRLNEAGLLRRLKRVSSVSGGSITAAQFGLAWQNLGFDESDVAAKFEEGVVNPLRRLASHTIDVPASFRGLVGRGTSGDFVAEAYRKYLYGNSTLRNLPDDTGGDAPRFVINATNLQTGALWRFSRPYMADYQVGCINNPAVDLATAVAASSAFPPFLSPVVLHFTEHDYSPCPPPNSDLKPALHYPPFTTRVVLTDGGVYDNLGIETVWKKYSTVLVSDGGGKMSPQERPWPDWISQFLRVRDVTDNQVRSLRKRNLQASYDLPPGAPGQRFGAYWSMRANIAQYHLPGALWCPYEETLKLAGEPTRLARLNKRKQERLVNWGYAICDTALRRAILDGKLVLDKPVKTPAGFPYPGSAWSH